MKNTMRPIHPGDILREELAQLGLSPKAFSKKLFVPANRISTILNESRYVTANTALRLARFFGSTPKFWLNLQCDYDLKVTAKKCGKQINNNIQPLDKKVKDVA